MTVGRIQTTRSDCCCCWTETVTSATISEKQDTGNGRGMSLRRFYYNSSMEIRCDALALHILPPSLPMLPLQKSTVEAAGPSNYAPGWQVASVQGRQAALLA